MIEMVIEKHVASVLLAAGKSSRLGRPKQLLKINDEYLINSIIRQIESSRTDKNVIVLGAYEEEVRKILRFSRSELVVNGAWSFGIGASIKCGLRALLKKHSNISGVLFTVVDQPALRKEHLDRLIDLFYKDELKIVASNYENTTGIPALFGSRYFDDILNLGDGGGCKGIIKANINRVVTVDFPSGAFDIDTEEDLMKYTELI